jgi:hypothetical protein
VPRPGTADLGLPAAPTTVGAYDVALLSHATLVEIAGWLDRQGYAYAQADLDAVAPYVESGWTVVALRMNLDANQRGLGLAPMAFTWAGSAARLPLAISRQPQALTLPLTVYVYADGRYELPGASVAYAWRVGGATPFLTRLELMVRLDQGPERDPVAMRVADTLYRETATIHRDIRIPVRCQALLAGPSGGDEGGGCQVAGGVPLPLPVLILGAGAALGLALRSMRRRR